MGGGSLVYKTILGLIVTLLSSNIVAQISEIEVFTSRQGAIEQYAAQKKLLRAYRLIIHNLNSVEEWEEKFSVGLSSDEVKARAQVEQRIEDMGGQTVFNSQVLQAYNPLLRSVELGLMEYPSVVIDGTYVLYGTDDVSAAIDRYGEWLLTRED